ncbi:hypothetical protein DSO57_1031391 [Entomophthora muscae]|uniref:Uncharacterized protein n=1 Tax=Entomophthora muscae TaxID=34485 RepID=A0ACC2UA53_9FUNG|nr:hypothetical protein DSO57_1031391 [Entomophthora muscae]
MKLKELIFAGTGASSGLPIAACINRLDYVCPVCNSALTLAGAKNRRNNTSLIIVTENAAGFSKTILIDCGKTFNASTLDCFLKNKIRRIDAVILTHSHA